MGGQGGGSLISLDGVAPSWIVGVSASDISLYTIKSRSLLAPAHPGSPLKMAIKWMHVCIVLVILQLCWYLIPKYGYLTPKYWYLDSTTLKSSLATRRVLTKAARGQWTRGVVDPLCLAVWSLSSRGRCDWTTCCRRPPSIANSPAANTTAN